MIRFCTSSDATGSKPAVGSSKKMISGSFSSARARPDTLTESLGQAAAEVVGTGREVDGLEGSIDSRLGVAITVESREEDEILRDAQA